MSEVSTCACTCNATFMGLATAHARPSRRSLSAIHLANRSMVSSFARNKVSSSKDSGSAENAGLCTVSQGPSGSRRT